MQMDVQDRGLVADGGVGWGRELRAGGFPPSRSWARLLHATRGRSGSKSAEEGRREGGLRWAFRGMRVIRSAYALQPWLDGRVTVPSRKAQGDVFWGEHPLPQVCAGRRASQ